MIDANNTEEATVAAGLKAKKSAENLKSLKAKKSEYFQPLQVKNSRNIVYFLAKCK